MMLHRLRVPRESVFLLGYIVLAAMLCVVVSVSNSTDRVLFLLTCPLIFAAFCYPRWMYLTLLTIGASVSFIARRYIPAEQSVALPDMAIMLALMIVVVEALHWLANRWRQSSQQFRTSTARYQLLVDQSPTGLYLIDLNGILVECNQALVRLFGYDSREQILGRSAAIFYPDGRTWQQCAAQVLRDGTTTAAEVRMCCRDGTRIWVLKQATRVDDANGRPTGIIGTLIDITQRKRAEDLQEFLNEAIALLTSSLNDERTLGGVAKLAVARFADWCTIVICDPHGAARCIALECADPNKQWIAAELRRYPVRAEHMFLGRTGGAEFLPELPTDYFDTATLSPRQLELLQQIGARSAITVPMIAREQTLGTITLMLAESDRRYDREDLQVAKALAHHTAQALETSQLYHQLQRRLTELLTVDQVARAVNSSLQLADVFQVVVSQINAAFGYRMISSYLLQDDVLHLQAHTGYDEVLHTIPISQGVSGRVVRSGQAVFTKDSASEPDFLFAVDGVTQAIIVPLKRGARVLGMLAVETNGDPVLSDDDYALLKLLAEQISIAVANAHLFTDLHASEQRYRTSEERYRLLADNSLDLIGLLDLQGNVRYASPSHEQVLGYTADEVTSGNLCDRLHPDDYALVGEVIQHIQAHGDSRLVELHLQHKQGGWVVVEALVSAIMDSTDTCHLLFSGREITERKRAEEARRQLERKMLEAQKLESLGLLAGGIAHDFNNLLTAIAGYIELARLEMEPQTPAYYAIDDSWQVLQRAGDLTRQLLAYAGQGQLIVAPVDINAIIYEMTRLVRSSITKTATLRYDLAPRTLWVRADATQMRQVVMNLVINAAEALPNGAGTITIRTGMRQIARAELPTPERDDVLTSAEYLYLEVTDTGHGMDAHTRAKIFEPFFTTKSTGRGLGLAAVLGIVHGHGGTLNVESTLGGGTTFTILMPVMIDPLAVYPSESVAAAQT